MMANKPIKIEARYNSSCHECGGNISTGDNIIFDPDTRWTYHLDCSPSIEGSEHKPFSSKTDGFRRGNPNK